MFTKKHGDKLVILLIYVNDLLITGNDDTLIYELKCVLRQNFRKKELGDLKFFLVLRSNEGIVLSQRK